MKGSIISAAEGDLQAAQRAQAMARDLIERHRPADANCLSRAAPEDGSGGPID